MLVIIVEDIFGRGIEVQASQSPQLVLGEAVFAEALHDAAHLGSGCQGSISCPQHAGARRRLPVGNGLALVTHLEVAVGVLQDLHVHTRVAGALCAGQQLEGVPSVFPAQRDAS